MMGGEGKKKTRNAAKQENSVDRLRRTVTSDAMSVDLVSAFAGDRKMTAAEGSRIGEQIETRGGVFFSDLFYAVSHQYFAPEIAERIREGATTLSCGELDITISVGVALCNHETHSPRALFESVDRALYQAKTEGKNRVVLGVIHE